MLRNDSTLVLLDAVVRNDSIVEVPPEQTNIARAGPPRAVALADAVEVELWQSPGERVAGGVGLSIVAGLLLVFYAIARALSGPGS